MFKLIIVLFALIMSAIAAPQFFGGGYPGGYGGYGGKKLLKI